MAFLLNFSPGHLPCSPGSCVPLPPWPRAVDRRHLGCSHTWPLCCLLHPAAPKTQVVFEVSLTQIQYLKTLFCSDLSCVCVCAHAHGHAWARHACGGPRGSWFCPSTTRTLEIQLGLPGLRASALTYRATSLHLPASAQSLL